MTWKELKQEIERIPVELQEDDIDFLDGDMILRNAFIRKHDENIYFNPKWDTLYFESELTDEDRNDPLTVVAAEKDKYYFILN